jgi:hypothetical protein
LQKPVEGGEEDVELDYSEDVEDILHVSLGFANTNLTLKLNLN